MTWLEGPQRSDIFSSPIDEEERQRKPRKAVRCSSCGHRVAADDERLAVAGQHRHTCVNPAGVVYRIACFRKAAGCKGQGSFVAEHSWFAGYGWQVALCGNCLVHIGWAFRGDAEGFHGLIEDRLRSD
jgi:hypothetical protein